MTDSCSSVVPGKPLNDFQQFGLELIARIAGGRDVVLAIDLTESVGFNDEGQLRLRQIIEDSLKPGDSVYIVPFATVINPQDPATDLLSSAHAISFHGKKEDIERILKSVPRTDLSLRNTDIQKAELSIYQELAQLNQCRLALNQAIQPQSVVWFTDAPLFTKSGIEWIETPTNSPFRVETSLESQQRQAWLESLPRHERQLSIETQNGNYNLAVVDIQPTLQEFCSPAPGGQEPCLVSPYILRQLWLPMLISVFFLAALLGFARWRMRLQKKWKLTVKFDDPNYEEKICYLSNQKQIEIGNSGLDAIDCPGNDTRAYLERQGERLFLIPTQEAEIFYKGTEVTKREFIEGDQIRLNCPNGKKDFEITISVKRT